MAKTILLTSFATWKPEQPSNSSNDLLEEIIQTNLSLSLQVLRLLPVDFDLAPQKAIAHFNQVQPDILMCCGMAESRAYLSLESSAVQGNQVQTTSVNLAALIDGLMDTEISHDAGQFVCNRLYYAMLEHLQQQRLPCPCVFAHVPVLNPDNRSLIVTNFRVILERLAAL